MTVYGRHARTGLASSQEVYSAEISQALTRAVDAVTQCVASVLERVPPEIANDIYQFGLMLSGGCAVIPGLPDAIRRETGLKVTIARNPRDCVINGLGRLIAHPDLWDTPLEYRLK